MFLISTNYPQYLSLDLLAHSSNGVCDYGHITPWLTRCPMVKIIKYCIQNPTYRL
ncbi:hypothetical protein HanIR_Chr04g0163171 [Helianthus annuus]|nr:hypothetical protein HanIR_Chr04g0163171 [Helianthus annuus]